MPDIPSRELRNDVSAVLRRVESGERMTVTVSGRPVARLMPLPSRPKTVPTNILLSVLHGAAADPALAEELVGALPDTTDSVA